MTSYYKYENLSEEDRNALIPAIKHVPAPSVQLCQNCETCDAADGQALCPICWRDSVENGGVIRSVSEPVHMCPCCGTCETEAADELCSICWHESAEWAEARGMCE